MTRTYEDRPLVGPGSELQLTLDGRVVPHEEVVEQQERLAADERAAATATDDAD